MCLLKSLIIVSEKAANIARICRQDKHLFELLVQEKEATESNPRFVQDFKTLADVLIQETVKYEIGRKFPQLKDEIKGEENNTFCNKLGEVICVEIQNNANKTAKLLEVVLNGDSNAARLLAEEVHRDVNLEDINLCSKDLPEHCEYEYDDLGIWIDPIDSTAEYISGKELVGDGRGIGEICVTGLACVTVLIGVYDKTTGIPVMGTVNQPFHEIKEDKWRGRCHWGLVDSNTSLSCSCKLSTETKKVVCISNSENEAVKKIFKTNGFTLIEAAGAGYKMLTVITGLSDAYILSKDTTFKWDTCGPQAILKSLGGNVIHFKDSLKKSITPLTYVNVSGGKNETKVVKYCNTGGIIAYKNESILNEIMGIVSEFEKV